MRWGFLAAVVLAGVARAESSVSSVASAQPTGRWGLTWQAPPACIDRTQLLSAVTAKLGREVFGAPVALTIDGALSSRGGSHVARLTLVDSRGTPIGHREVKSSDPDCHSIDQALVLVVSVMIDPSASLRRPPPSPSLDDEVSFASSAPNPSAPPPPPPSAVTQPTPAPLTRAAPPPKEESLTGELAVGAAAIGGLAFSPTWAGTLDLRLAPTKRLRFHLRLQLSPYAPFNQDGISGFLFLTQLAAGLGFNFVNAEPWSFVGALGVSGTAIVASVQGLGSSGADALLRPEVGANLVLRRWFGPRFGASVGAWVGAALSAPRFTSTIDSTQHPVGWPVSVGLDIALTVPLS